MTKIDRVLKELSELYDFNRKLKAYKVKEKANEGLESDAKPRGATSAGSSGSS